MKPSERFADLKQAVEDMGEGQDKQDLLALFQLADKQHDIIRAFDGCKQSLNVTTRKMGRELADLRAWRQRNVPTLELMLAGEKKEKLRVVR
jgi:hypothetical protein